MTYGRYSSGGRVAGIDVLVTSGSRYGEAEVDEVLYGVIGSRRCTTTEGHGDNSGQLSVRSNEVNSYWFRHQKNKLLPFF